MPLLIHAAELARQLKCSRMAISKAFNSGRISQAGTGPKGKPLFDLEQVRRVFVPDPAMTVRPDGLQGGRPVYRRVDKQVAPAGLSGRCSDGRPASPTVVPGDWCCREELEDCWPELGASIDDQRLRSVGTFPGSNVPAYSFLAATRLMRPEFAGMTDAEIDAVLTAELDAEIECASRKRNHMCAAEFNQNIGPLSRKESE